MNKKSMPNPFPGFNPNIITVPTSVWNPPIITTTTTKPMTRKASKGIAAGNDGVLIHVILDESSSMSGCRDQTISAFNEWLDTQKQEEGKCLLTICKFNGSSVNYITENQPIKNVEPLSRSTYSPGGMTNLLDAIGENLERIDGILRDKRKNKRPGVMTIVMTDGEENRSNEFNKGMIAEMISSREEKDWVFTFLGANIDAFAEGSQFGFRSDNTLQYSTNNMSETMTAMSNSTSRVRGAYSKGLTGASLAGSTNYTSDERSSSMGLDIDTDSDTK